MPSHLENPFRPPIPTVVDYEKEAHAIGLLLGPKAEAAYRKRHAHDLSDPSASVSSGLTPEEQAQMDEKPKEQAITPERREQIRAEWGKFFTDIKRLNVDEVLDSMEIHDDGAVSFTKVDLNLIAFVKTPPMFPTKIRILDGYLSLENLTSAESLILPEAMTGGLYLTRLPSADHLALPRAIGGPLNLLRLESITNLVFPRTVGGSIMLRHQLPRYEVDSLFASRPDLISKISFD